ncbi:conserved hypothetical protein [Leptospira interrogans serovar Manilae]|uniref:Uncharacterized protein n=1 Tax=Leptospira interrogans serovar Manilae TaxID=214675 RepID=A0AAQ1P1T9_LEPIR|nr:conserved hypothetical protein [Leptospira interrogans serovar Manilae]
METQFAYEHQCEKVCNKNNVTYFVGTTTNLDLIVKFSKYRGTLTFRKLLNSSKVDLELNSRKRG